MTATEAWIKLYELLKLDAKGINDAEFPRADESLDEKNSCV